MKRLLKACAILTIFLAISGILVHVSLSLFYAPLYVKDALFTQPVKKAEPEVSVLKLPLSLPISDLNEAAERYTPKTYTDVDYDFTDMLLDDSLTYNLSRGPITMELTDNGIALSFPVTGTVRARGKVNLGVTKIKVSAHSDLAGVISGRISFKILPDWRIEPDIDYHVNITKALIPIKNVGDISLRTFLEDKLSRKIKRRKNKLTEKIMSKDIIRDEVTAVWKKMHRVEKINDAPSVWARVVPQKVEFLQLVFQNDGKLTLGVSLSMKTALFLTDEQPSITISDLPDATILTHMDDGFRLVVPVSARMAALNRFIESQIKTRTVPLGKGFQLYVTRADLVSAGNNRLSAIIFAHIQHPIPGLSTACRLYVHGRLDYDSKEGTIRITDFSYDAVFSRSFVQAIHWVIHPYLRYRLEEALSYSMVNDVTKAHDAINQWIKTLVVPPGVTPSLSVNPPKLLDLSADRNGLNALVSLTGHISATLTMPDESSQNLKDTEKK